MEAACAPPLAPADAERFRRAATVDRWQRRHFPSGRRRLHFDVVFGLGYLLLFGVFFAAVPAAHARPRGAPVRVFYVPYLLAAAAAFRFGWPVVRAALRGYAEHTPVRVHRRLTGVAVATGAAVAVVLDRAARLAVQAREPVADATVFGATVAVGAAIGGVGVLWAAWLTRRQTLAAERRARARRPAGALAVELGGALLAAHGDWRGRGVRERVARHVVAAAEAAGAPLAASLRVVAPGHRAWLERELALRAGNVRALECWLALPRGDTAEQFRARVRVLLGQALTECWDELERPAAAARPRRPFAVAGLTALVLLVAAALPAAAAWASAKAGWMLGSGQVQSALLLPYLLVVVSLLRSVNPEFEAHVKAAREVGDALTPAVRKNGG